MRTCFLAIIFLLVIGSNNLFAQQEASATVGASAGVSTPIVVTKSVDMVFGPMSISMSTGGTIVLSPDGRRKSSGGVTIPTGPSDPSGASFTVASMGGYAYYVTLPTAVLTDKDCAPGIMNISDFTTSVPINTILNYGTQTISVGATLTVSKAEVIEEQEAVIPFNVTIIYN